MSGRKESYTSVSESYLRKLRSQVREANSVQSRIESQMRQQESRMRSEFKKELNYLNNRARRQEKMISSLNYTMQSMEKDFQENINRLDIKVDILAQNIEQKEQNKKEQASVWLQNAKDALRLVETYNHNKFTPNRYDKLSKKLTLIQSNFDNETYEASISSSQALWEEAYELRIELEQLEKEWNTYLTTAIESNTKLIAACNAQEIVDIVFDTENGEQNLEVEIDYWCNGELSQLKDEALKQQESLKNSEDLDVEAFKKMIQTSEEIYEQVVNLTQKAKDAIILSQLRSDMASDIVDSLDDAGFNLVDSCFKSDDERFSIHLKLQNISGDEVVTIISPQENMRNKLDIHFFDKNSDENFKQTRLKAMMKRLNESGIECTKPQCTAEYKYADRGDEKTRDFKKLKEMKRS